MSKSESKTPIRLGLALQGGGSHGAFTQGALQALLYSDLLMREDTELSTVSGTSAGAVNGAILCHWLNHPELSQEERHLAAIENLDKFWQRVGRQNVFLQMQDFFNSLNGTKPDTIWPNLSPDAMKSRENQSKLYKSLNIDLMMPLRTLIRAGIVDWKYVQQGPINLSVNAVQLRDADKGFKSGNLKHKVFAKDELTLDAIAASAALKMMGPQIVNGVPYYDGAYLRNPYFGALYNSDITDLLVVVIQRKKAGRIRPVAQADIVKQRDPDIEPRTLTHQIYNQIAFMQKERPDVIIHTLALEYNKNWNDTTRYNTDPEWIRQLEEMGYKEGERWVQEFTNKITDPKLVGKHNPSAVDIIGTLDAF